MVRTGGKQLVVSQDRNILKGKCMGSHWESNPRSICTTETNTEPRHLWWDSGHSEASAAKGRPLAYNNIFFLNALYQGTCIITRLEYS